MIWLQQTGIAWQVVSLKSFICLHDRKCFKDDIHQNVSDYACLLPNLSKSREIVPTVFLGQLILMSLENVA